MEHEIRVPITPPTAQLLDALSATWQCSYRDALARCVVQAAREQAKRTRLLAVLLRQQGTERAAANSQPKPGEFAYEQFGGVDAPHGWFPGCED